MDRDKALLELSKCNTGNIEADHSMADDTLCKLLIALGYQDVVDAWEAIEKWYA